MSTLPKIIDNNRKNLLDILKEISKEHDHLSIATGYWDLKGTQQIFESIKNYKSVRLLIGREPLIPRHKAFRPEPDYPDKDFFSDLENMQPSPELKSLVISLKSMIKAGNLEVRVYRKSFFHAKSYIFGDYSSDNAVGIIGSSNFTLNGLTHNAELNALEDEHRIVTFKPMSEKQEVGHLYWFDSFWNDPETEEWNGQFTELLGHSPVGDVLFSPYETYIKTLYEIYNEELVEEDIDESIKGSHDLYDFQKKNVNALIRRLKKYKVAMLADSVGLGKTYTAIEVIKQYLTTDEGKKRVEVICPKSLVKQWRIELNIQGVRNFEPLTLQNPEMIESKKKLDDIAAVSLFVIDESHNLKNSGGKRFDQILDWVRNNPKAHVLLLTATPINNQLSDIVNQILLGARGESGILNVTTKDKKSKQTATINFHQAIENLKKKINQDLKRTGEIDYDHIKQTMSPILRAFVVRRTRQGIEREYGGLQDGDNILKFPKVNPEVQSYKFKQDISAKVFGLKADGIDIDHIYKIKPDGIVESTKALMHPLRQLDNVKPEFIEEKYFQKSAIHFVYQIILLLGFIPYRWSIYKTRYYGKSREQIKDMRLSGDESRSLFMQLGIYGILRTVFLKRLESSVSAIRASLEVYKRKLEYFEKELNKGYICSLKDFTNIDRQLKMSDNDEDNEEAIIDDETVLDTVDDKKYALEDMKADIKKEKLLIDLLSRQLSLLEEDDSKIKSFAELLEKLKKDQPAGKKVLVFSFFADTITYLEKSIGKYTKCITNDNTAFVSSKNRTDADTAANRFAPVAKKHTITKNETELDYLFSTDILSEGQNLQDCGILINYDLHWNPVRMIQRNGRINRIGSPFEKVHIYNIKPEAKLEEYLKLVARLETKINLIRNTIGTDSPVLDEKENPIEFTDSWKDIYSDSLQKRIEAMEKAEKEADFLLSEDEYISDLKIFNNDPDIDEKYKEFIYNISKGKWAVMPKDKFLGDPRPDTLCLNRLYSEDNIKTGYSFASLASGELSLVPQLQALEWLKTDKTNNERQKDRISADKKEVKEIIESLISDYHIGREMGTPIGQSKELLTLMFELHFIEEDILLVEKVMRSSNVFLRKEIQKLIRKVMKNKKENKEYYSTIKELVEKAKNDYNDSGDVNESINAEQILYYVVKNE
ncbi:MAG: DEAD/DEAH box helicase family protein [Candidatus Delongbacteria bacterium]|nr:DEAD/DEAH box helicase family protein [Candidatus Delongbacteria bacterium]MCG2761063.1 phospholipase D-like domain-containing protein [Candidatus Delongbacteria bacterium]